MIVSPSRTIAHVVIPARNEELLLGSCLESIRVATDHAQAELGVTTYVTVVLDRCTDRTDSVATAYAVDLVVSDAGSLGGVRSAGIERVLEHSTCRRRLPGHVWVAMTDADSCVPPNWLTAQLELARIGYQLVVGGVHPDPADLPVRTLREWSERDCRQLNIHGANLGFTLDLYTRGEGFPPVDEHEDVIFVHSAIALGCRWTTDAPSVKTSGRTAGRTPGGFAGYLRTLLTETKSD